MEVHELRCLKRVKGQRREMQGPEMCEIEKPPRGVSGEMQKLYWVLRTLLC